MGKGCVFDESDDQLPGIRFLLACHFYSLVKVAEIAGLAGVVSFHQAGDDYLVTFPDVADAPKMAADFRARLRGLENNIWNF